MQTADPAGKTVVTLNGARAGERPDHEERVEPRCAHFAHLKEELRALPRPVQLAETLLCAARLLEEAGYTLVQDRTTGQAVQLLFMSAQLDRKVTGMVGE